NFTLKSKRKSNFYIDLRILALYPKLLNKVALLIGESISQEYDGSHPLAICGLPYGGIPLATLISQHLDVPLLIVRKEKKKYGTNKQIEGIDKLDSTYKVVIIDDIITSGTSINEFVQIFEKEAPHTKLFPIAFIFIDRQEEKHDMKLTFKSVFTLCDIKTHLNIPNILDVNDIDPDNTMTFGQRAEIANNNMTKRLFRIMERKKTNLVVSFDTTNSKSVSDFIEKVKDYVCAIKFHSDAWSSHGRDWLESKQMVKTITNLAIKYDIMLFEDRKFADIGATVEKQYTSIRANYGNLDMVTVLPIFGEGTLKSIDNCSKGTVGMVIVSQVSTKNNLLDDNFTKRCVEIANNNSESVVGFVCQTRVADDSAFIYMTPGVKIGDTSDGKDQQYRTPEQA
ncbi:MAG: orotidine-5'-phosphate decarboxylase, partial [Candidatus Heimdallarchaeota archaeon]|nr:orotidine-5'-phosphate decarboxylase [Candidatus Heimdallarchaeota archaeon]